MQEANGVENYMCGKSSRMVLLASTAFSNYALLLGAYHEGSLGREDRAELSQGVPV